MTDQSSNVRAKEIEYLDRVWPLWRQHESEPRYFDITRAFEAGYREASRAAIAKEGPDARKAVDMVFRAAHGIEKHGPSSALGMAAAVITYRDELAEDGWRWDASADETVSNINTAPPEQEVVPIDMVLHCPKCGMQHIDSPEKPVGTFYPGHTAEESHEANLYFHGEAANGWDNPPHKSHLCHGCGHIWRPADVPTNGVQAVKTTGKADSAIAVPPAPEPVANPYRAEFLWPHEDDSLEEAGYEFANCKTREYQQEWWNILLERARDASPPAKVEPSTDQLITAYGAAKYEQGVHHRATNNQDQVTRHAAVEKARTALRASLAAREGEFIALREAAECIRHWHDRANGGMVVSGEHVRKLWEVLANIEQSALAIEQRIRDEGIELAGKALDEVKAAAPDGVTKLYLHTLALKVRALKGTK